MPKVEQIDRRPSHYSLYKGSKTSEEFEAPRDANLGKRRDTFETLATTIEELNVTWKDVSKTSDRITYGRVLRPGTYFFYFVGYLKISTY